MADLRDHLFETIEALKDPENPMNVETARAISGVAQMLIETAKVEVDLLRVVGGSTPHSEKFFGHVGESRDLPRIAPSNGDGANRPRLASGTK
jgi:hypothetical protein